MEELPGLFTELWRDWVWILPSVGLPAWLSPAQLADRDSLKLV